jgi:hypothetical protein
VSKKKKRIPRSRTLFHTVAKPHCGFYGTMYTSESIFKGELLSLDSILFYILLLSHGLQMKERIGLNLFVTQFQQILLFIAVIDTCGTVLLCYSNCADIPH